MSVAVGAGPSNTIAGAAMSSRDGAQVWTNVKPLDRSAAGAVGEWVDLLARISHDLRTPLNAVIGFSDVMQQELFGPLGHARYQEYVRHIRTSGVELLHAAEDALAMTALLAEPKTACFEDVTLLAALNDAMDELTGRFGGLIPSIEIEMSEDLQVRSDRRVLTRAIRQLLQIALIRVSDGAQIRIAAEIQHGLVDFRIDVAGQCGSSIMPSASAFDAGLGRRDLGVWLATALLDLVDCRLTLEAHDASLVIRTTLEEICQPSFLAG